MSWVGLSYPREMARIRGANRRGLTSIIRDQYGEAVCITVRQGVPLDEVREYRAISRKRGTWQDRHWKREQQ